MAGCLLTKIIFFRCPTPKDTLIMLLQTSYVETVWTDADHHHHQEFDTVKLSGCCTV